MVRYLWNFGDGTTSTEKEPVHIYSMPGIYTVKLYGWDSDNQQYTMVRVDYVRVHDWSYASGGLKVSNTDTCLRFAVPQHKSQGVGWSVYNGSDWPFPEAVTGVVEIVDGLDERVPLVTDCHTFRTYQLGRDDHWIDGQGEYASGSEIESEVLLREHVPPIGASAVLEHSQSHAWIKPWFKDRRDTGDYDHIGFRRPFSVDLFLRRDASPDDAVIAKQVPREGQVVFDRNFKSRYIQMGIRMRGAPWRLVKCQQWYQQIDSAASPDKKYMSEAGWRDEWAEPVVWFSRGDDPTMNLATGIECSSAVYVGLTTGPDAFTLSAVTTGPTGEFPLSLPEDLHSDFAISVWEKNPTSGLLLYSSSDLTVTLQQVGGEWEIAWVDSANSNTIPLTGISFGDWVHLVIERKSGNLVTYVNGSLADTQMLAGGTPTFTGSVRVHVGSGTFCDFRIINRAPSENAVAYLYADMIENQGDATCPMQG